jgi:hypothetical protein
MVTTWRSDPYHVLRMCHGYIAVRIRFQQQRVDTFLPPLFCMFHFCFCFYCLYYFVKHFNLHVMFVSEWGMNMTVSWVFNHSWSSIYMIQCLSQVRCVHSIKRNVWQVPWTDVVVCHHRQFYRLFLLLPFWAQQSYHIGSVHLSGCSVTTVVLRTARKETCSSR